MTYDASETGAHSGSPIEGYKFEGTSASYYYTSAEQDVTINGQLYTAAEIGRNAIKSGTQDDGDLDIELTVPYDLPLVLAYAYGVSPPDLTVTIFRYHDGDDPATDFVTIWKGIATGFSITGHTARIRVPSIFSTLLSGEIPTVYYHNPCNHVLYDARCKVVRASYLQTTTVSSITDDTTIVVADDGFADNYLVAGEINNTTKGERRLIVDNVSNTITLGFPFSDVDIGDTVELVAGCDHSFATCGSKYSNKVNYGGFPFVPYDNPFTGEL